MQTDTHTGGATMDAMVWLPYSWFTREQAQALMQRLTARVRVYDTTDTKAIPAFRCDHDNRKVGVPVAYGLHYARELGMTVEHRLSPGQETTFPTRPDPRHPKAPADQPAMMQALFERCQSSSVVLVKAPTGSGKTVVTLGTVGELGRNALVILKTRVLAQQWVDEAMRHLGLQAEDIGRVMEGRCEYEGRKLVVATLASITQKEFPPEFYSWFGTVIWDEAHLLGAEMFSTSLCMFPARYRIALTATPNRKDGAENLFLDYFGAPSVEGTSDALPVICRVINRRSSVPNWAVKPPHIIQCLTADRKRNMEFARLLVTLQAKGWQTLAVSDRVQQLHIVMEMCRELGMPPEVMGLFARQRIVPVQRGKKVTLTRKAVKDTELAQVKENAQIIFATYGMAKEGLDIPRLNAGVDLSPRADGVQLIGRLRRPFPNKWTPVWFTTRDVGIRLMESYTTARLRDFATANVEIRDA